MTATGRLEGKVALVTGAGSGIGRRTAIRFAEEGASVVAADLRGDAAAGTAGELGGEALGIELDVTSAASVGAGLDRIAERFGGIDIVVNNAGLTVGRPIWEMDPETFERVSASHATGTFNCIRCAAPHLRARGGGRIVNLVSRAGLVGVPGTAAYAAGKGAVFALTNVAARDLKPFGITVNAVNPASTETRMVTQAVERGRAEGGASAERAAKLLATLQSPEDVARVIVGLCLDEASDVTGQVLLVSRDRIGLFRPLAVDQDAVLDAPTVEAVVRVLREFRLHAIDSPY